MPDHKAVTDEAEALRFLIDSYRCAAYKALFEGNLEHFEEFTVKANAFSDELGALLEED